MALVPFYQTQAFAPPGEDSRRYGVWAEMTLSNGRFSGHFAEFGSDMVEVLSNSEEEQIKASVNSSCQYTYRGHLFEVFDRASPEQLIGGSFELRHPQYTCVTSQGETRASGVDRVQFLIAAGTLQVTRFGDECSEGSPSSEDVRYPVHISADENTLIFTRGAYQRVQYCYQTW
ncbi:MAG: hypothetical protein KGQ59_04425 [Bdellovibrionales bacterium]|nr:hypothetical protein [Bdellovibrionales bacterium]